MVLGMSGTAPACHKPGGGGITSDWEQELFLTLAEMTDCLAQAAVLLE